MQCHIPATVLAVTLHGGRTLSLHGGRTISLHGGRTLSLHGGRTLSLHGRRTLSLSLSGVQEHCKLNNNYDNEHTNIFEH